MRHLFGDLLILILLCVTLVFLWFHKGLIFAGGEEGIPFYDLNKTSQFISFTWQDISGGLPIQLNLNRVPYFNFLRLFYQLGLPGSLVQALHFLIITLIGVVSMYFLLHETLTSDQIIKKDDRLFKFIPLIGAIFYLLNPFSMIQIWGRGIYIQFFSFALFPLFLLMFILGLKKKNFVYGALGILASVFLAGVFGNPSYIFSLWAVVFLYFLFYIFKNRNKNEILFASFYFIFMLVGWTIAHMWWIYPFIKISSNQFSSALNNLNENIGTLRGVSKDYKLPSLLRLIHEGYLYRDQQYGSIYLSFPFLLLSWLIPIAAFFSYSIFKKLKIFVFFGEFFLFSLFVCLGSNFPTGWLFVFLFKTFPPLQAFRNPFEKFGVVLTIAYAPFFATGAIVLSQKISRVLKNISPTIFLSILMILIFGVFLWPMWTGQFAGGVRINPWVKVPDYYKMLDDWLNQQKDDGRIIHFPINPGDGLKYSGWEYPYQGIEPGEYIFSRPSIGKYGQAAKPYYSILLQRFNKFKEKSYGDDPDFVNSEFRSGQLYEELAKLNVRFLVLHYDIDPTLGEIGQPEPVADYLAKQLNIKKVNSFGKLDVYKVDIPNNIHLVYSPQIQVSYKKINPALYKATASSQEPFDLYFLENFDPNWEVMVNGEKAQSPERLFSYANKWRIENIGDIEVTIKYKPQDFVEEGMKITKIAVVTLLLVSFGYLIWRRKS